MRAFTEFILSPIISFKMASIPFLRVNVDEGHPLQAYEELDDISKEIINILEQHVKPAVASDGGNIMFDSYDAENKTVQVILQGACSGCPSSTFTLKNGIEAILKEMMGDKINSEFSH